MPGKASRKDKFPKKKTPKKTPKKGPAGPGKNLSPSFNRQPTDEEISNLMSSVLTDETAEVEAFLKKYPASVDVKNHMEETALYNAAFYAHNDMVKILLAHGANPDVGGPSGSTPLLRAAQRGHLETVKLLLGARASINVADEDNETPLILAVWENEEDVVKLLLEHNADVTRANNEGQTALSIAKEYEREELIELLERHAELQAKRRADAETKKENDEAKASSETVLDKLKSHKPTGIVLKKNPPPAGP